MKKVLFGVLLIASVSVATTKANSHLPIAPGIFQDTTHKMSFTRKGGATKPSMEQPRPLPITKDTVKTAPKPATTAVKHVPVTKQPATVKPVTPAAGKN